MSRLINLPKNIIFLLHGYDDTSTKDSRGNTKTKHVPSNRIPDKVLDVIEGKLRYFLRAYIKSEMSQDPNDERQIKKRYLSLVPKANEYGIARGLDEANCPHDIELDWDVFADIIGLNDKVDSTRSGKTALQSLIDSVKPSSGNRPSAKPSGVVSAPLPKPTITQATVQKSVVKQEVKEEPKQEVKEEVKEEPKVEKISTTSKAELLAKMKAKNKTSEEQIEEAFGENPEPFVQDEPKEEIKPIETAIKEPVEEEKPKINQSDISAKIAALKAIKNKK